MHRLAPGERIVLTTDGITEAHNSEGVMFGEARFDAIVHLEDLDEILDHVARFQASTEAEDDWTVVDIRYTGPTPPPVVTPRRLESGELRCRRKSVAPGLQTGLS